MLPFVEEPPTLGNSCNGQALRQPPLRPQLSLDHSHTQPSQPPSSNISFGGSFDQPSDHPSAQLSLPHSKQPSLEHCQPLITVTVNPLESPDRRMSIGSAHSLDQEPEERHKVLKLSCSVRRVSDISHIHQLRREISGLSHLASEFYTVTKSDDPDNISLDR